MMSDSVVLEELSTEHRQNFSTYLGRFEGCSLLYN